MSRILLVDDAALLRTRCAKLLREDGYDVVEAENGLDAVEKYRTFRPDGVLMDVTMPEMDGISALKEIRRWDPRARVTMLTALGQQQIVAEAFKYGAYDYILKPFQSSRVVEAARKMELQPPPTTVGRKVLVVDDDARLCGLLAQMLRRDGHEAVPCAEGIRARQLLQEEPFDAVITDINLAGVSGWDVVAIAAELRPRPLIVFVAGWGSESIDTDSAPDGVDAVLPKPLSLASIRKVFSAMPGQAH